MAHKTTLEAERPSKASKKGSAAAETSAGRQKPETAAPREGERERVWEAFRRWGYLEANLDPLGLFQPVASPDLDGLSGEAADEARRIYCGTAIGAEFMHLPQPERRE